MKTLILVRHAKSDWPENTDDFDRPLAERGLEDAVKMSKFLKDNNIEIQKFVSSPAVRALNTCKIFNQTYDIEIDTNQKLYNPSERNFESVIYDLENDVNSVAMFSHNNGISNFANSLSSELINLPTCGIVAYEIDCDRWCDFEMAEKRFLYFYSPKNV